MHENESIEREGRTLFVAPSYQIPPHFSLRGSVWFLVHPKGGQWAWWGRVGVGLSDLQSLFQPERFCDSLV